MKKFVFRLQKAADWYRQKLSAEEAVLQSIVSEIHHLDQLTESLRTRQRAEQDQIQDARVCLGRDLQSLASYSALIQDEIGRVGAKRQRLEARSAEQRQRVISCHRRVRLMEKLEQRRRGEWLRESTAEENSTASELFLASFARQTSENGFSMEGERL